jgi:diaminopimelate decarboxylase
VKQDPFSKSKCDQTNNINRIRGVDSGFQPLNRPMLYGSTQIDKYQMRKERFYSVLDIFETDTFANNRRIPEIKEGDILSFRNAGAYCYSMASNYNSRYRPAVLWMNGQGH